MLRHARLRCHRESVRRGTDPLSTVATYLLTRSVATRLTRRGLLTMWTTAPFDCAVWHMPVRNFSRSSGARCASDLAHVQGGAPTGAVTVVSLALAALTGAA